MCVEMKGSGRDEYQVLPEVRHAILHAEHAERTVDQLAQVLVQALTALAEHDVTMAQNLRGIAVDCTRGITPDVAKPVCGKDSALKDSF